MGAVLSCCCKKKNTEKTSKLIDLKEVDTTIHNKDNSLDNTNNPIVESKEEEKKQEEIKKSATKEDILIDFTTSEIEENSRKRFITFDLKPENQPNNKREDEIKINLSSERNDACEAINLDETEIPQEILQRERGRTGGYTNKSKIHSERREKVKLGFKIKNTVKTFEDVQFNLNIMEEISEDNYVSIGKNDDWIKGEYIDFEVKSLFDFIFGKLQKIKCVIKCSNGSEFTIKIPLGKILGSRKIILCLDPQGNRDIEVNYKFSPNKEDYCKPEVLLFEITGGVLIKEDDDDRKYSSLNLNLKLNLPIIPPKRLFYVLKRNSKEIYTSEIQSSSRDFVFMGNHFQKSLFSIEEIDAEGNLANVKYSIEFLEKNPEDSIFALSDEISFDSEYFSKNIELPIKSSSQLNKQIGKVKLGYSEKIKKSFSSALEDGLQISLIIGIDYTSSNLDYTDPNSLHHLSLEQPNPYEEAIIKCGAPISFFDYDQLFPVYGFGGIPPNSYDVSHCFNANMEKIPEVKGIEGILDTYRNSISKIKLSGPTYFAPIIRNVLNMINNSNNYYVLLLLTDGQIDDFGETINMIVKACVYPISILIVGIGTADFSKMKILDGDNSMLVNSKGEPSLRDIVQFTTFSEFSNNVAKLAEDILKELPSQIENYLIIKNN